jgi:hypothetical protein
MVARTPYRNGRPKATASMQSKLRQLRRYMADGDHRSALRLAAGWAQLGEHRDAITQAWAALTHPAFYEAIGRDPAVLVARGLDAIRSRYRIT